MTFITITTTTIIITTTTTGWARKLSYFHRGPQTVCLSFPALDSILRIGRDDGYHICSVFRHILERGAGTVGSDLFRASWRACFRVLCIRVSTHMEGRGLLRGSLPPLDAVGTTAQGCGKGRVVFVWRACGFVKLGMVAAWFSFGVRVGL